MDYKQPVSVLVVVYTGDNQFLLIERAAHPGYWQSVTGSLESGETLEQTAERELREETGLMAERTIPLSQITSQTDLCWTLVNHHQSCSYEIFPEWQHRYAPGVTQNIEHLFSFQLPSVRSVMLSPNEHRDQRWLSGDIAASACFSPSNQVAITLLSKMNLSQN